MSDIEQSFTLEKPVTVKGVAYTVLNARRPKVRDMRMFAMANDNDPIGAYNKLLASLCTVPPEVFDDLDFATDYKVIKEWLADFLPKSKDGD